MTSPHQDAADLVAELRARIGMLGPQPEQMLRFMNGMTPLLEKSANLIEQQAKALSEAEALAEERLQNYRKGMSVVRDLNMRHKRELADTLKSAANTFEAYREVELRALAAEAERDTLRARLKEATAALSDARKTMRNAWGAVSSGQIFDKDVEWQLKRGIEAADEAARAFIIEGGK